VIPACEDISGRRTQRNKLDDRSQIEKVLKGDLDAFRELVRKYEAQVAATVIGMLGPGPEAEDIGQETFIRFYKALRGFRGDAKVGTYLTRIAINLCLNEIKRRGRRRRLFTPDGEKSMERVADNPGTERRDEAVRLVRLGLRRLDPKHRAVILLRLVQGYSSRETARILRLPLGTVLSRLARGREKLKEILSPLYLDGGSIAGDGHD
jgi:RNA polymerase sigma-70 factor (ECF subfamily)